MVQGTFIAESLQVGVELLPSTLRMTGLRRVAPEGLGPQQPTEWTLVDFQADDRQAEAVEAVFTHGLKASGGWYADFWVGNLRVVVFAERIFRYERGDHAGRAAAVQYGLSRGAPAHQLDWSD